MNLIALTNVRWLVLASALAAGPAVAGCPPQCAMAASVVNAAGVPEGVAAAAGKLRFDGPVLAATSAGALRELAAGIRELPPRASVTITLAADTGLSPRAAADQVRTRQQMLSNALRQQGVTAERFKLVASP